MKTLRIAQAALATILAMGINSTTYAFMAVPAEESANVQTDLTEMVSSLQEEIAAGETSCEDMLAKLDAVLEDIDAKLDEGVENEEEYLEARDTITDMRYDLECLANDLTQFTTPGPAGPSMVGGNPGSNSNAYSIGGHSGGGGGSSGGSFGALGTFGAIGGAAASNKSNGTLAAGTPASDPLSN